MGLKDVLKNVSDLAKDSYTSIQNDFVLQNEEQQRLRNEMNTKTTAYVDGIIQHITNQNTPELSPFLKADIESLNHFTKDFYSKLFLPSSSQSSSCLIMDPNNKEIPLTIKKYFSDYDLSETILFQFSDSKDQFIIVTSNMLYFKIIFPDSPTFFGTGIIPLDKVFNIEIDQNNAGFNFKINNITLLSSLSFKIQNFDFIALSDYLKRISSNDFVITPIQIDQIIREKTDQKIISIINSVIPLNEHIIYLGWGFDKITAKDFVVCTTNQFLFLTRDAINKTHILSHFTYDEIDLITTREDKLEFLDFSLVVDTNPNTMQLLVSGVNHPINCMFSYQAQRIIEVFNNYKKTTPTTDSTTPNTNQDDPFEKIEKLALLKEKGIITDEEFNQKKQELLSQL